MDADAGASVRRMKDSSLVRAAEAVRDGRASAMVSAGNTGATMASALLRMGRIKGVARPAIATPDPGARAARRRCMLDAGANAECKPEWLVQFAQMGAVYARDRFGIAAARVGAALDRRGGHQGQRPGQGDPQAAGRGAWIGATGAAFVGNVEGRDLMTDAADVVVTDGFTGNVALKTLEGGMRALVGGVLAAFDTDDATREAAERAAAGPGAALRPARPRERRRRHAARASTACASSATARRRPRPWSTPSGWPETWWPARSSSTCARRPA